MNLQENIRRILREEIKLSKFIRSRVLYDDLEREFEESLDMSSNMLRNLNNDGRGVMSLERFIDVTTSILMDSIHYDIHSSMPEDYRWYDEVIESLKNYFRDRIENRYRKLVSNI